VKPMPRGAVRRRPRSRIRYETQWAVAVLSALAPVGALRTNPRGYLGTGFWPRILGGRALARSEPNAGSGAETFARGASDLSPTAAT
jgi:hypothetical protein